MTDTHPIMRVGRTLGRTLYRVVPGDDRKADECVGIVDTREIAEAICAAVNVRGVPLPATDAPQPLPSAGQIRAWLTAHAWREASRGTAGTLWYPPHGQPVGVPDDDDDPFLTAGALERIASRSHLSLDSLTREMRRLLHD